MKLIFICIFIKITCFCGLLITLFENGGGRSEGEIGD